VPEALPPIFEPATRVNVFLMILKGSRNAGMTIVDLISGPSMDNNIVYGLDFQPGTTPGTIV